MIVSPELDSHCRAAELLIRERQESGRLTIDSVLGHARAEALDPRVLCVLCFGYSPIGYPDKLGPGDGLLAWACNLAAEAAGLRVELQVARG